MRITPLAVWCYRIKDLTEFESAIRLEVSLSHSSITAQDAAICYCLAIRLALQKSHSRFEAYDIIREWASKHSEDRVFQWFKLLDQSVGNPGPSTPIGEIISAKK
jgi:ADP-ribosylglycohydrolase